MPYLAVVEQYLTSRNVLQYEIPREEEHNTYHNLDPAISANAFEGVNKGVTEERLLALDGLIYDKKKFAHDEEAIDWTVGCFGSSHYLGPPTVKQCQGNPSLAAV